ncbi:MAG TPA: tetratricopeptide repeat protein [Geminicoccaceae bacterium]
MRGDEFIREVDEAVRQERWLGLWKTYGTYIVGGAIAVVLGTTAGVGWREWQESSRLAEARQYAEAARLLRSDQPEKAADAFAAIAEDGEHGYAVLARLRLAEARAAAGDPAGGTATLEGLAEDDGAGELYRQLSRLLVLQQQLQELGPERTLAELQPLLAEEAPWRHSALELKALAELEAGAEVEARNTLSGLVSDPTTPSGVSRRASELLQALGGPVEEAAPAGGAGAS